MNVRSNLDFLDGVAHPEEDSSHYQERGDTWKYNDSGFADYCAYAPAGTESRIRSALGRLTNNVALDIAGGKNGQALQDLLKDGLIDTGIVTNLSDRRDDSVKNNSKIIHLEGDLVKAETWQAILDARSQHAPEGFSLVMFRPIGALDGLSFNFYKGAAGILLDNLRAGGVLLSQIPDCAGLGAIDREAMCEYLSSRPDVSGIFAPKVFQGRPTALVTK